MAGSQQRTQRSDRSNDARNRDEARAGEYAREALSEWGRAIRLGAAAAAPRLAQSARTVSAYARAKSTRLKPRNLLASPDGKGGRVGDLADLAISKMGRPGRLASKASVGSRIVERMRPDPDDDEGSSDAEMAADGVTSNSDDDAVRIPLQESIEVAVPVKLAYRLASTFDDYPAFTERVESVEMTDERSLELDVKVRGSRRRLEVEIENALPNQRVDWRCEGEIAHLGVVTFHELAPRLTHVELSIDWQPSTLMERLSRSAHLTERAIHAELQRFKAYAELWEDEEPEDSEPLEGGGGPEESSAEGEETGGEEEVLDEEGEEIVDEEDEEVVDEEDLEEEPEPEGSEDELDADEPGVEEAEEELEPARAE